MIMHVFYYAMYVSVVISMFRVYEIFHPFVFRELFNQSGKTFCIRPNFVQISSPLFFRRDWWMSEAVQIFCIQNSPLKYFKDSVHEIIYVIHQRSNGMEGKHLCCSLLSGKIRNSILKIYRCPVSSKVNISEVFGNL